TPALPRRPPPSFYTATKCRRTARSSRHLAGIRRCDGSPSSVNARATRDSDAEEPLLIIDQALDCKFDEPRFALFVRCVVSDWRVITASVLDHVVYVVEVGRSARVIEDTNVAVQCAVPGRCAVRYRSRGSRRRGLAV